MATPPTPNGDGYATMSSVSCPAPGDCAAGGSYGEGRYNQAFVVDETGGAWGTAIRVPGTRALHQGGVSSRLLSVSCSAPGDCAAGGYYSYYESSSYGFHARAVFQAFVVNETNGRWGDAIEVPGSASLNTAGRARINSVSCTGAGECAAGGFYLDRNDTYQGFVVSETNGIWGQATQVRGTSSPDRSVVKDSYAGRFLFGTPGVAHISCAVAGECAAGGFSFDTNNDERAFVVDETNGSWGEALEVPGLAKVSQGRARVDAISCVAPGDCAAGGHYDHGTAFDYSDLYHAFVVTETNGTWSTAIEVPGTAKVNTGGNAGVSAISCTAPGECVAGGHYDYGHSLDGSVQAFVVTETNSRWGQELELPGTATLNVGHNAGVDSISCTATGDCAVAGTYWTRDRRQRFFVAAQTNGRWGKAIQVPGGAAFDTNQFGDPIVISCSAPSDCAAVGDGDGGSNAEHAFVAETTCVVPDLVGKKLRAAERSLAYAGCGVNVHPMKGRVSAQQPKPGTIVNAGTLVALSSRP